MPLTGDNSTILVLISTQITVQIPNRNRSFWQQKVHADIPKGSPDFYENLRHTYVYLSPYVVLVICPKY